MVLVLTVATESAGPMPEEDPKKKKKSRKASSDVACAGSSSSGTTDGSGMFGDYGHGDEHGYHGGGYVGEHADNSNSGSRRHGQDGKKSSAHSKGKGKDKSR